MSLDLEQLTRYASEAERTPMSPTLRGQCVGFAAYLRKTKWHFSVREESKELAKRFEALAGVRKVRT